MNDYGLVLPFTNDTLDFTLGYECGVISEKMERGAVLSAYMIHAVNIEQVKLIAKRYHYDVAFELHDGDWATMNAQRTSAN